MTINRFFQALGLSIGLGSLFFILTFTPTKKHDIPIKDHKVHYIFDDRTFLCFATTSSYTLTPVACDDTIIRLAERNE